MEMLDNQEKKEDYQKELVQLAKMQRLRKKLISILIILAVFLVSVASAWLIGRVQVKNKAEASAQTEIEKLLLVLEEKEAELTELKNTPILLNRVAPEIVLDIVSTELNSIGELATVEYAFTDATSFKDSKEIQKWNWSIPGTEKSFLAKWNGTIKAGIQIDKIQVDVDEATSTVLITLPKAEILSYEVDNASMEILDEKSNIFNPISVNDKVQVDAKVEEEMKQRAIDNGLLDMAQKNAESIIASLLCVNPDITGSYTIEFVKE